MLKSVRDFFAMLGKERNDCSQGRHDFFCAQRRGKVGEAILYRNRLSTEDVVKVGAQPELAQQVCPGGEIMCRRCHVALGQPQQTGVKTFLQGKIHPRNHFPRG